MPRGPIVRNFMVLFAIRRFGGPAIPAEMKIAVLAQRPAALVAPETEYRLRLCGFHQVSLMSMP